MLTFFCWIAVTITAHAADGVPFEAMVSGQYATSKQKHTTVHLYSDRATVAAGEMFTLALRLEPAEGWHTYWINPGDTGLPLTAEWQLPEGFTTLEPRWPTPERIPVDTMVNYGYHKPVDALISVQAGALEPQQPLTITAKLNWLVCSDICIPEEATLILSLKGSAESTPPVLTVANWLRSREQKMPVTLLQPLSLYQEGQTLYLPLSPSLPFKSIQGGYFFASSGGILPPAAPQKVVNSILQVTVPEGTRPQEALSGVVEVTSSKGERQAFNVTANPAGAPPADVTLLASQQAISLPVAAMAGNSAAPALPVVLLLALLGGLLLNIMPCVLPVLSIKALSLVKLHERQEQGAARREGILYAFGVLSGFAVLGLWVLGLRQAGEAVGWGFQMQQPGFVAAMTMLLFVIGLYFSGAFAFSPAVSWSGRLLSRLPHGGAFATGILAVVVATPCTVPFMATAVGVALAQSPVTGMAVFLMLGLGMALPFLLIALFPACRRLLPKPGAWMETFRQCLAFPLYASAAWLLWVLARQTDRTGLALVLAALVFLGFAGWLLPRLHRRGMALLLMLLTLLTAALVVRQVSFVPTKNSASLSRAVQPFSTQALQEARSMGKTVFVNVTADWCLTCKVNERLALARPEVQKALHAPDTTYLLADWTTRDAAITTYLASLGREGVPLYVVYRPGQEPQVLPQLLTEKVVLEALEGKP